MNGKESRQDQSFDLLSHYLKGCGNVTENMLARASRNELSREQSKLAREISHSVNIMSAIYFYRQEPDLAQVLERIPSGQRRSMEEALTLVWEHLLVMNAEQIADLAIEALQKSANVTEIYLQQ